MRRFRFTLETVLELRRRREDDVKRRLGIKRREIVDAKQCLADLGTSLKDLQEQELEHRESAPSVQAMRASVLYRFKLKRDMLIAGRKIDLLYDEAGLIQEELTKAVQKRRALELLRDKRFAAWKKDVLKVEQNQIDDVSQQGYIRRQNRDAQIYAQS